MIQDKSIPYVTDEKVELLTPEERIERLHERMLAFKEKNPYIKPLDDRFLLLKKRHDKQ